MYSYDLSFLLAYSIIFVVMSIKKQIGVNAQRLRVKIGLSQTEVCTKLHISQAQLSRIENGNGISLDLLERLAHVLNTTPAELIQSPGLPPSLLEKMKIIEKLPKKTQQSIVEVIDALLLKESQKKK